MSDSQSPPTSPRVGKKEKKSKKDKKDKGEGGGGGLLGDLMSYYYNNKASVGWALTGEARLADEVNCYVLGRVHCGPNTTEWTRNAVACVSYFTYRNRLPVLLKGGLDHDAGWGCMIRTGQMMFLECLQNVMDRHREAQYIAKRSTSGIEAGESSNTSFCDQRLFDVSRETSAQNFIQAHSDGSTADGQQVNDDGTAPTVESPTSPVSDAPRRRPLRSLFMDTPDAPFGLHRMTEAGERAHIKVGEWFNPTALSFALVDLVSSCPTVHDVLEVIIARDGLLVRSDVLRALSGSGGGASAPGSEHVYDAADANGSFSHSKQQRSQSSPKSVLVLIPLMLGAEGSLPPSYFEAVCKCFELSSSVGIVGGKPKMSLYFVGHQSHDNVFYLDPHVVQSAYVSQATKGQTAGPRGTCKISNLDPCVLLCFVFHSAEEFLQWEHEFSMRINPLTEYPMFSVAENPPKVSDMNDDMNFPSSEDECEDMKGNASSVDIEADPDFSDTPPPVPSLIPQRTSGDADEISLLGTDDEADADLCTPPPEGLQAGKVRVSIKAKFGNQKNDGDMSSSLDSIADSL